MENGEALITTLDLCDDFGILWEQVDTWHGPIWTGDRFIFAEDSYGDIGAFHELCHYMVAADWQIKCPDFGLGRNQNSYGDWTSYLWPVSDAGGYDHASGYMSWCGEDRVTNQEGGYQETLAVCAMGLYAILNPDEQSQVVGTMSDFGAWQPPNTKYDPWTAEMNHEIVDLIAPCLDIDPKLAFEKMEYYRMLGADDA